MRTLDIMKGHTSKAVILSLRGSRQGFKEPEISMLTPFAVAVQLSEIPAQDPISPQSVGGLVSGVEDSNQNSKIQRSEIHTNVYWTIAGI